MTNDTRQPAEYEAKLDSLSAMFADDFDWETYYEVDNGTPDDLFRELYRWHDYVKGEREVGACDCGGHRFEETPKVFYRAMYLFAPSNVDLSDMYKTGTMIDFVSPCKQFMGSLQLFKYEMQLYYGCTPEHLLEKPQGPIIILGGSADSDNGVSCKSDLGNKWFQVVVKSLEREWMVYGGNDFVV